MYKTGLGRSRWSRINIYRPFCVCGKTCGKPEYSQLRCVENLDLLSIAILSVSISETSWPHLIAEAILSHSGSRSFTASSLSDLESRAIKIREALDVIREADCGLSYEAESWCNPHPVSY